MDTGHLPKMKAKVIEDAEAGGYIMQQGRGWVDIQHPTDETIALRLYSDGFGFDLRVMESNPNAAKTIRSADKMRKFLGLPEVQKPAVTPAP